MGTKGPEILVIIIEGGEGSKNKSLLCIKPIFLRYFCVSFIFIAKLSLAENPQIKMWLENLWNFSSLNFHIFFWFILYYPGFYSSLRDQKQRNGSIYNISEKFVKIYKKLHQKGIFLHKFDSFGWNNEEKNNIYKILPFLCFLSLSEL